MTVNQQQAIRRQPALGSDAGGAAAVVKSTSTDSKLPATNWLLAVLSDAPGVSDTRLTVPSAPVVVKAVESGKEDGGGGRNRGKGGERVMGSGRRVV